MDVWEDLEIGFGGSETANFGPRQESGSALYQVDTLATISPTGEVSKNPVIQLCSTEDNVSVCAETRLTLLAEGCQQHLVTLSLENHVIAMCLSPCGQFLAWVEADGTMQIFHVASQKHLFSKRLTEEDQIDAACMLMDFQDSQAEDGCNNLLIGLNRNIWCFSNIALSKLATALEQKNMGLAKQVQEDMSVSVFDASTVHDRTEALCLLQKRLGGCPTVITAGFGEEILCVWEKSDEEDSKYVAMDTVGPLMLDEDAGVTKLVTIPGTDSILTLFSNETLVFWSAPTLTVLYHWDAIAVKDFLLLDAGAKDTGGQQLRLVVMTASHGLEGALQIYSLPARDILYTLQLSSFTLLGACPVSQEAIYIVEGVDEEGGPVSTSQRGVSSLRIRCLTEAQPETRLSRLLHKKKFSEAERFAEQFSLDVQLVYKVKATYLLDMLSPWNCDSLSAEDIQLACEEFHECMKNTQDVEFVVTQCVAAAMPTLPATVSVLSLASEKLSDATTKATSQQMQDLKTTVSKTLHRLGTYQVAFGAEQYRASQWEYLSHTDMLHQFLKWLTAGELHVAFTIWRRHQSEFEERFNHDLLEDILTCIPEESPSAHIKPWLTEDLIPYVTLVYPEGLADIAVWLDQRARNMELTEREGWPQNALDMCNLLKMSYYAASESTAGDMKLTIPKQFTTQVCSLSVGYSDMIHKKEKPEEDAGEAGPNSPLAKLQHLAGQLRDLVGLHTKYNCKLSLAQYCQETTESLMYRMLDRVVANELIPSTLQNLIKPYMKEHLMDEDRMLWQYICDLVNREGRVRSYLGEAPWEVKSMAVIHCIKDPEYQCMSILEVTKKAHVPWSQGVQELVDYGLTLPSNRISEIKHHVQLMELKKVLLEYNLPDYNVAMQQNAETLMRYILKADRETALQDALEVVKAYSHLDDIMAYMFRIRLLIAGNRLGECIDLIRSLPEDKAYACITRVITMALVLLNDPVCIKEKQNKVMKILTTRAAVEALRYLLTTDIDPLEMEEHQMMLKDLKNILALQVDFGEFITYNNYMKETHRRQAVTRFIEKYLSGDIPTQDQAMVNQERKQKDPEPAGTPWVSRFGRLMGFSREEVLGQLAVKTVEVGEVDKAVQLCKQLYELTPLQSTGQVLHQVALHISSLVAQGKAPTDRTDLPSLVHELASQAATLCHPDLLQNCVELGKCTGLLQAVTRECESGDYGVSVQRAIHSQDVDTWRSEHEQWLTERVYREDGLVMESDAVLPLANKYTLAKTQSTAAKYNQLSLEKEQKPNIKQATLSMCHHLHQDNHLLLTIQYAVDFVDSEISQRALPGVLSEEKQETSEKKFVESLSPMLKKVTIQEQIFDLLVKVISQKRVDYQLALGLLTTVSQNTAGKWLRVLTTKAGNNYKRVMSLGKVGKALAELYEDTETLKLAEVVQQDADWGHRLAKLKISFMHAFRAPSLKKKDLVPELVSCPGMTADVLMDYCSTYRLPLDGVLLQYLDCLFQPPQPGVDPIPEKEVLSQADTSIRKITDKAGLYKKLESIFKELDPYNYAKAEFLLQHMHSLEASSKSEKGLHLLKYLESYKRMVPPCELDVSYTGNPNDTQIVLEAASELSKIRIPLHPLLLGDPWKIITHEVNPSNVELWLKVASLLKADLNLVYMATIKNMVEAHMQQNPSSSASQDKAKCRWGKDSVDEAMFEELLSLLLKITNSEMAISCGTWVVKTLPMGAEKVMALKTVVSLTKKWVETLPAQSQQIQKAQAALDQFSLFYRRLLTEQVLFLYGLGSPDLVSLSKTPAALSLKMFEHGSIIRRTQGKSLMDNLPDIHGAVREIADINSLNLSKILVALVEKWLPSTALKQQEAGDVTLNAETDFELTLRMCENMEEEEDNLKRVVYILQQGTMEHNASVLFNFVNKDSSKFTPLCRVRALRCLFSVVDHATIEKYCRQTIEDIRQSMQTELYLHELNRLHITHTHNKFTQCNKEGLAKSIFRSHSREKMALSLVCGLCLDYGIYDPQLWNTVLKQMNHLKMHECLQVVLVRLAGIPQLWHLECLQQVWMSVLMKPLAEAVAPLTEEQEFACLRSIILLHRCPLILQLDTQLLYEHYERLELPVCMLACFLLLPDDEKRTELVQKLLGTGCEMLVLQQLQDWADRGWILPMAEQIEDVVYKYIDSCGSYHLLHGTPHLRKFVQLMVAHGTVDGLLVFGVKNHRLEESVHLFTMYCESHQEVVEKLGAITEEDPLQLLQLYLNHVITEDLTEYFPEPEPEPEEAEPTQDISYSQLSLDGSSYLEG